MKRLLQCGTILMAFAGSSVLGQSWNVDQSGDWSDAQNWTNVVPNGAGAEAVFGDAITTRRTVTVDKPVTIGSLFFRSANPYTITGSNPLTLDATLAAAQILVTEGSHTISAPLMLADDTIFAVLSVGSALWIAGTLTASGQDVAKAGTGTVTLPKFQAASLSINQGTVAVASNGGVLVVNILWIAGANTPTATLNLANNSAIINYDDTSPAAAVRGQVLAGRGGPGLGATWNGMGITSSAAALANTTQPESRSVGYAENSAMPLGPLTTFHGQAVDDTSILMAFTRTGDANLDGVVNDDDVTIVGATYAPGVPNPNWAVGDFDSNGFIDDDDVTLLGAFFDPSAPPLAAPIPAVAAIPEPSSASLVALVLAVAAVLTFAAHLKSAR